MKRGGQILGLPLILVFSLIVGAFILLYGAKVILDLSEEADYVSFLERLDDLDATLRTFENYDSGSSKVYALDIPKDIETICFYGESSTGSCTLDGGVCPVELEEELALVLDPEYNIYIFPQGVYDRTRFTLEEFQTIEGDPICVSQGGSIVLSSQKDFVGVAYDEPA